MKTLRKLREGLKVTAVDTLGKTIPKSKINSVQGAIMKRDIQGTRQDESTMGAGEIDAGLYTKKNIYPKTKTKSAAVGEDISQRISAIGKSAKDSIGKVIDAIPRPFDSKEVSNDLGIKDKSAQNIQTPNAVRWNSVDPKSSKTKVEQVEIDENSNPAFHNPFSSTKSSSTVDKIQKAKTRKINQPGQGVYKKQTPSTRKRVVNNYMKMLKDIGEQTEYTVKHGDTEHTVNDYDHAVNKARSILAYGKAKEVYIHTNGNPTHKWQLGKHIEKIKEDVDLDEAKRPDRPPPKTNLRVGDKVVADTSKEDYPGGHKQRVGVVTRVGEKGVHIKTSDSNEPEWHPHKIVKKQMNDLDEAGRCWTGYKPKPGKKAYSPGSCVKEDIADFVIGKDTMDSLRKIRKSDTMTKDEKSKAATEFWNKPPSTKSKVAEDNEQLDERGLDVGHQKRQMSKHFDRYIQAVRAGKFNQARMHYKKYNEHKQTLQKTGHTN